MPHYARHAFGLGLIALLAIGGFSAAQTSAPTNSLPNPYRSIENWGTLPAGRAWGSTSAVAIDPDGTSVWVAERCGESRPPSQVNPAVPFGCDGSKLDPILKFDSSGKLLKSFGAGLMLFPHGIHVDRERQRLGDRRPRPRRQGSPGVQVQPRRQAAADARQGERRRAADRTSSTRRPPSSSPRTATSLSRTDMAATPTRAS